MPRQGINGAAGDVFRLPAKTHDPEKLAALAAQHPVIRLLPGEHRIASTLLLGGPVNILGHGATLKMSSPGDAIWCNRDGTNKNLIRIDGLSLNGKGKSGHGLRIGNEDNSPISAQVIWNGGSIEGFDVGLDCIAAQGCTFRDVSFSKNRRGAQALANRASTNCRFDACWFNTNDEDGFYIEHLVGSVFNGCWAENNGHNGYWMHQPGTQKNRTVTWIGGWAESNARAQFRFTNGVDGGGSRNQDITVEHVQIVKGATGTHHIYVDPNEDADYSASTLIGTPAIGGP